jgi:hypothetical protein
VESTSYQTQLAACGAAVDKLRAEHPDAPDFQISINIGPVYGPIGKLTLFVDDFAAVVEWGRLLGVTPKPPYGPDCIQSDVTVTVDGVRIMVIGNSLCNSHGTEHDHDVCLKQARAEVSADLTDLAGVTS